MSINNSEILDKVNYTLVRLDNFQDNVLPVLQKKGFVMVNIDVDADKIPYGLFVKKTLATHERPIKEYFVAYKKGNTYNQKLLPGHQHPITWINDMNKKIEGKSKYILLFFKEIRDELTDVDNLRF